MTVDPAAVRHGRIELSFGPPDPDFLARWKSELREAGRDTTEPYDVVVALPPGSDPAAYVAAGATWWLVEFPWDAVSVDQVRGVIREGPGSAATGR